MVDFTGKDVKALNLFLDRQIDIDKFGEFRIGLSDKEINTYLKQRYNSYANYLGLKLMTKGELKSLRKNFDKIAGVNTLGVIFINGEDNGLMYRYDVKRFADLLFMGKSTLWD